MRTWAVCWCMLFRGNSSRHAMNGEKKQNIAYAMKRKLVVDALQWRQSNMGSSFRNVFGGWKLKNIFEKTDHLVSFQVAHLFRTQIRKIITASEMVHHCSGQLPLRLGSVLGRRNRQSTWCFSLHPHGAAKKVKKVLDFRTDFLGHSTIDAHCLNQLFEVYI